MCNVLIYLVIQSDYDVHDVISAWRQRAAAEQEATRINALPPAERNYTKAGIEEVELHGDLVS